MKGNNSMSNLNNIFDQFGTAMTVMDKFLKLTGRKG